MPEDKWPNSQILFSTCFVLDTERIHTAQTTYNVFLPQLFACLTFNEAWKKSYPNAKLDVTSRNDLGSVC